MWALFSQLERNAPHHGGDIVNAQFTKVRHEKIKAVSERPLANNRATELFDTCDTLEPVTEIIVLADESGRLFANRAISVSFVHHDVESRLGEFIEFWWQFLMNGDRITWPVFRATAY